MIDLDNVQEMRRQDPEGMVDRIAELPDQLREAWQNASGFSLPPDYADIDNVVIMGLGGSAIGGDLARTLVAGEARVPIEVVREYDPPGYVGPRTLAIATSYSGNTEETLAAYEAARRRGAKLVVLTTGGQLLQRAHAHGVPAYRFTYRSQPRAALGHSLVPLLVFLQRANVIADKGSQVEEAARVLTGVCTRISPRVPVAENAAKQLANDFHGRLLAIYGGGLTAEVARRWKGQLNENAKHWATFDVLPELDHNSVVGYEYPAGLAASLRVVFLETDYAHERVKARFKATQELLRRQGIQFHVVRAVGGGPLAQMLGAVYLGDFTSYYLAMLNGVDPTPVKAIDWLKAELAKA